MIQKVKKNGIVFTAVFEYDAAGHISESIIKSYYTPKKGGYALLDNVYECIKQTQTLIINILKPQ